MNQLKTYLLTLLLTFLCLAEANAQTYQLDQFDKNKAFSSSGGINFSQATTNYLNEKEVESFNYIRCKRIEKINTGYAKAKRALGEIK